MFTNREEVLEKALRVFAKMNYEKATQMEIAGKATRVTGNQEYIKIGNEATSKIATIVHQKR